MKAKVISALALGLIGSILAGCGGGNSTGSTATTNAFAQMQMKNSTTPPPTLTATPTATATTTPFIGGGTYIFTNPESGLVLDVRGCGTTNGIGIDIYNNDSNGACENGAGQHWAPTLNSDSSYTLVNPNSNEVLNVAGCGTANGTAVQLWANGVGVCNNGAGQHWKVQPNSNGTITFVNVNSGNALDIAGCGESPGTTVQTWANGVGVCKGGAGQQWTYTFAPSPAVTAGTTYVLTNPESGLVLDVRGCGTTNGTGIDIYNNDSNGTCENGAGQLWTPTLNSDGSYTMVNPNSNEVLDVAGCGMANGTPVQLWANGIGACNNGAGQHWIMQTNSNTTYTLVNVNSGNALDIAGCGESPGTNVQTWANGVGVCNDGAGQQWTFAPASSSLTLDCAP